MNGKETQLLHYPFLGTGVTTRKMSMGGQRCAGTSIVTFDVRDILDSYPFWLPLNFVTSRMYTYQSRT